MVDSTFEVIQKACKKHGSCIDCYFGYNDKDASVINRAVCVFSGFPMNWNMDKINEKLKYLDQYLMSR